MPDISVRFDVPVRVGGGFAGWGPELAVVSDGARRVLQVVDWVGGEGDKPDVGQYIGATGLVNLIIDAVDVRGSAGVNGDDGADGSSAEIQSKSVTFVDLEGANLTAVSSAGAAVPVVDDGADTGFEPSYAIYRVGFAPQTFEMSFMHNGGGSTGGVSIGFQYSTSKTSGWTDGHFEAVTLSTFGNHLINGSLGLSGSGPYYIRPAIKNNEAISGGDESVSLRLWTLTLYGSELVAPGGGGGGGGGSSTTYTLASLRALTPHNNNDLAFVRFGTTPGDGVAGPRYYDSSSTAADDGNDVIKPTDVSGAGRWIKIYL